MEEIESTESQWGSLPVASRQRELLKKWKTQLRVGTLPWLCKGHLITVLGISINSEALLSLCWVYFHYCTRDTFLCLRDTISFCHGYPYHCSQNTFVIMSGIPLSLCPEYLCHCVRDTHIIVSRIPSSLCQEYPYHCCLCYPHHCCHGTIIVVSDIFIHFRNTPSLCCGYFRHYLGFLRYFVGDFFIHIRNTRHCFKRYLLQYLVTINIVSGILPLL